MKLLKQEFRRALGVKGAGTEVEPWKEREPTPSAPNSWGRRDLRVTVEGFGQVYWHHLLFWAFQSSGAMKTWTSFLGREGMEVDHGENHLDPLVVDVGKLVLKPKGGLGGNASQGARVRLKRSCLKKRPAAAAGLSGRR